MLASLFFIFAPAAEAQLSLDLEMSDGVRLKTDFYAETYDPQPLIILRTPDGRTSLTEQAWALSEQFDALVVVQDIRGRGESEGEESFFMTDAQDGLETIGWIDTLGWSNGVIASWGVHDMAITQTLMTPFAPTSYQCQFVVGANHRLADLFVHEGTIRRIELNDWLIARGSEELLEAWDEHPDPAESYWEPLQLTSEALAASQTAGIHITGWFDVHLQGALDWFSALQTEGGVAAQGRQHLLVGAWTSEELSTGGYAQETETAEILGTWQEAWKSDCLHGLDDALDQLPVVQVAMMGPLDKPEGTGADWRVFDSWPPSLPQVPLYLRSEGLLSQDMAPFAADVGALYYEPTNPIAALGGRHLTLESGSLNQRSIELRDDVVVYATQALVEPVEIVGRVRAEAWVLAEGKQVDVSVRLTDVYPTGRSMLVATGIQRVVGNGKPQLVEIDLWSVAQRFETGHQISVAFAGSMSEAYEPAEESFSMFLAHSPEFPSRIILPVLSGLEAPEPSEPTSPEMDAGGAGGMSDVEAVKPDSGRSGEDTGSAHVGEIGPMMDDDPLDTGPSLPVAGSVDAGTGNMVEETTGKSGCGGCATGSGGQSMLLTWLLGGALVWARRKRCPFTGYREPA